MIENEVEAIDGLADKIALWAEKKGFWNNPESLTFTMPAEAVNFLRRQKKCEKLILIISEVIECMEGIRKNTGSSIEGFTNEEEEMADAIIRILDYAGHYQLRIGSAVIAKMAFNEGRPFKHGKSF